MFIIFVLILLGFLMGVLSVVYSVFGPFMENIGNVVHFNSAYYGALASIERAELVIKYKQPGFEGSGGILNGVSFGPKSDYITGMFGIFTQQDNGITWKISSRTLQIPKPGEGTVDYIFTSGTDSNNYNKLPYFTSEKLILTLDDTKNTDDYYNKNSPLLYFSGENFEGKLRLPPAIKAIFNDELLCDTCDIDDDGIVDDIVVNWIINGIFQDTLDDIPFSIFPTLSIFYYSGGIVDYTQDTAIRESTINSTGLIDFRNNNFSLFPHPNILTKHNLLSEKSILEETPFTEILHKEEFNGLNFGFGIISLLTTAENDIYPFLEYQFTFPQEVADTFFTIEGTSIVGDYKVKIVIKKPTNEQAGIGDFTIIF